MFPSVRFAAASWLALAAAAQDAPAPALPQLAKVHWLRDAPASPAKLTVAGIYPSDLHGLRDDAAWLADLQRRYRDRGLQVIALVTGEVPKDATRTGEAFALGADTENTFANAAFFGGSEHQWRIAMLDARGTFVWHGLPEFGIADAVERALDDKLDADFETGALNLRQQLLSDFENGGDHTAELEALVQKSPRDGFAWGALYLSKLWFGGDPAGAHDAGGKAVQALATDGPSLVAFADLALRADRYDGELAKSLAMALVPVAAAAGDSGSTQLAFLRALLRAGRDREAGRTAQRLPKLLAARPQDLLAFAATLADAQAPAPFTDLARQAIAKARACYAGVSQRDQPVTLRWVFAAEYAVELRCAGDAKAAAEVLEKYRQSEAYRTAGYGDLNNDSWYLSTMLDTMGRFDALALAQAEEILAQNGENISSGNQDTLALACFMAGKIDAAVEHQTKATARGGRQHEYVVRLQRFERTKEALAAAKAK